MRASSTDVGVLRSVSTADMMTSAGTVSGRVGASPHEASAAMATNRKATLRTVECGAGLRRYTYEVPVHCSLGASPTDSRNASEPKYKNNTPMASVRAPCAIRVYPGAVVSR